MAPFLYTHTHTHKVMFWFLPMKTFGRSCKCLFHDPFSACHQRICGHVSQRFFSTPPTARVCGHFSRFKLAGEWLRTFVTSRDHVFFLCDVVVGHSTFFLFRRMIPLFFSSVPTCNEKTWCYTFVFSCASCLRGYAHFWSFVTPASVPKGYGTDIDPFFCVWVFKVIKQNKNLGKWRHLWTFTIITTRVYSLFLLCCKCRDDSFQFVKRGENGHGTHENKSAWCRVPLFNETLLLRHFLLSLGKQKTLAQLKFLDFKFAFF